MWDLPGSGIEPMSPASAGGFFTPVSCQGSPALFFSLKIFLIVLVDFGKSIKEGKRKRKEEGGREGGGAPYSVIICFRQLPFGNIFNQERSQKSWLGFLWG